MYIAYTSYICTVYYSYKVVYIHLYDCVYTCSSLSSSVSAPSIFSSFSPLTVGKSPVISVLVATDTQCGGSSSDDDVTTDRWVELTRPDMPFPRTSTYTNRHICT